MTEDEKNEIIEKWSKLGLTQGLDNQIIGSIDPIENTNDNSFESVSFPIIRRVMPSTIAGGGWTKSKKQQLKEDRINKLRKLDGKEPNVILEKDEWIDGLVSVQPLSQPTGILHYMDFKYESISEKRKKKLKYIDDIIKNNLE
jgi:hypothetical protein